MQRNEKGRRWVKLCGGLLALCLGCSLWGGCSDEVPAVNQNATLASTTEMTQETAAQSAAPAETTPSTQPESATTTAAQTTATPTETAIAATEAPLAPTDAATPSPTATEAATQAPTSEAPAAETPIEEALATFVAPDYGCEIQIPQGWAPTEGAADGAIQSDTSIFQPQTPNGDSITLAIADAETPEVFSGLSQEQFAAVYAQSFANVSAVTLTPCTVDDSPAYCVYMTGDVMEGMPVTMAQLLVNREGGHLYSLTYTNVSGGDSTYADAIASYLHLT